MKDDKKYGLKPYSWEILDFLKICQKIFLNYKIVDSDFYFKTKSLVQN